MNQTEISRGYYRAQDRPPHPSQVPPRTRGFWEAIWWYLRGSPPEQWYEKTSSVKILLTKVLYNIKKPRISEDDGARTAMICAWMVPFAWPLAISATYRATQLYQQSWEHCQEMAVDIYTKHCIEIERALTSDDAVELNKILSTIIEAHLSRENYGRSR